MFVEFSIRPMTQPSGKADVSGEIETIEREDAAGRPRSMSASIEGSWEQVMAVIRGCHQAHAEDHSRVVTTIIVVDDDVDVRGSGWPRFLRAAVPSAGDQIVNSSQHVRRIPVEVH